MNEAFIKKMVEAKKMEAKAYAQLIPGSQNPHLKVIRNELKEMRHEMVRNVVSCVVKAARECYTDSSVSYENGVEEKTKKVKKVTIK